MKWILRYKIPSTPIISCCKLAVEKRVQTKIFILFYCPPLSNLEILKKGSKKGHKNDPETGKKTPNKMAFNGRFKDLNLFSLRERSLRSDLITVDKYLHTEKISDSVGHFNLADKPITRSRR